MLPCYFSSTLVATELMCLVGGGSCVSAEMFALLAASSTLLTTLVLLLNASGRHLGFWRI